MAIKKHTISIIVSLLFLVMPLLVFSQRSIDSLQQWIAGFHNYSNMKISANGQWLLASKAYPKNKDSIMIYNTDKPGEPKGSLVGFNNQQEFIGNNNLLAMGYNNAEYFYLPNFSSIRYEGTKKIGVLHAINKYAILNKKKVLSIYKAQNSEKIVSIPNVVDFLSDNKNNIFAIQSTGDSLQLIDTGEEKQSILHQFSGQLVFTELLPSGKYWAITEKEKNGNGLRLLLVAVDTGQVWYPENIPFMEVDFIKITEIRNGDAFLISYEKRVKEDKNIVDIWYSSDQFLKDKKKGSSKQRHFLWRGKTSVAEELPTDQYSTIVSADHPDYFLVFNTSEKNNYTYPASLFDLHLLSRKDNTIIKIAEDTKNVIISKGGHYVTAQNEINGLWQIYDIKNGSLSYLKQQGLKDAVFSKDNKSLLFSGENDIMRYDLLQKKLSHTNIARECNTRIIGQKFISIYVQKGASFRLSSEEVAKGLLIKAYSSETRQTSYLRWNGQEVNILRKATEKNIKEIVIPLKEKDKIICIEENYNFSPEILMYNLTGKSPEIIAGNSFSSEDSQLRRDIISYCSSAGEQLNGILYFPIGYKTTKKYPMIVRLYQRQYMTANKYLYPSFDEDGFNIRMLMENGYFVFLPDTISDERGSSFAALDCVNNSLTALASNANIDFNKMGLTGHSFGGYETNFIATRSTKFAAYISGAAISNLTGRYFSYNIRKSFTEYSRIETGQYSMNSFIKNKNTYFESNPVYFSENVNAPILLWAGLKDENVPADQTMAFFTGLLRNKKDVVALFYSQVDHTFEKGSDEAGDVMMKSLQWWDYFLKGNTDVPWIKKQMKKDAL